MTPMRHITATDGTIIAAAAAILDGIRDRLNAASYEEHDDRIALRRLIVASRDAEHAATAVRAALVSFEIRLSEPEPKPAEPQSPRVLS